MKIGGPRGPAPTKPPTPEALDGAADSRRVSPSDGAPGATKSGFKEVLVEQTSAAAVDGVGDTSAVAPESALVETIIAQLRAGTISGDDAVGRLIDGVVRARAQHLRPEIRQRLDQHLRQAIENDPLLAGHISRIHARDAE